MIGKVLGAFLGGKAAQHARGIDGATGAALGVIAPLVLRRLSWPAMVALGVGGYLAKKVIDKEQGKTPVAPTRATATQPAPGTSSTLP